jgi:hypothetical protein
MRHAKDGRPGVRGGVRTGCDNFNLLEGVASLRARTTRSVTRRLHEYPPKRLFEAGWPRRLELPLGYMLDCLFLRGVEELFHLQTTRNGNRGS